MPMQRMNVWTQGGRGDPVVIVDGSTGQSGDGHVDSGVGLTHGVIQNGAGHRALVDHLYALLERVNTDKVDVLAQRVGHD